jgi:hypothetical protein
MCACACGNGARCDGGASCPNDECPQCREARERADDQRRYDMRDADDDNPLANDPRRI